jgi:hypothetical protein
MAEPVSARPFRSFGDFWPFYVGQHRRHGTRVLHFLGTTLGLVFLAGLAARRRPVFLLWSLVSSYGLAWAGHFFIERNRPATFQHPLWSFLGDMRMYALMWRGRMTAEAERHGFGEPAPRSRASDSRSSEQEVRP